MEATILKKMDEDPKMHEFLMNHSYYYLNLNRNPAYFETFLKEYKKYKRETMGKKVSDMVENVETLSNIMSIM